MIVKMKRFLVLILSLSTLLLLVGCSPFKNEGPAMIQSAATSTNAFVKVLRVIDGSTIVVDQNGQEQIVKYAMIQAPELIDKQNADHARKYNETLISQSNGKVKLITDLAIKNQVKNPGVLVAYVILTNGNVANEEMIKSGLASVTEKVTNEFKREGKDLSQVLHSQLKVVETKAKKQMLGIWKQP